MVLDSYDVQIEGHKVTCREEDFQKVVGQIVQKVARDEARAFAKVFRENIILQLQMLPVTKKGGFGKIDSLRADIIKSITPVTAAWKDGKYTVSFSLDHPLAAALDEGTGEYGPHGTPIVPTTRKYMFIPGAEFEARFKDRAHRSELQKQRKEAIVGQAARVERTYATVTGRKLDHV